MSLRSHCKFPSRKETSKRGCVGYFYLAMMYMWKIDQKRKDASLLWWSGNGIMINDYVGLDKIMDE